MLFLACNKLKEDTAEADCYYHQESQHCSYTLLPKFVQVLSKAVIQNKSGSSFNVAGKPTRPIIRPNNISVTSGEKLELTCESSSTTVPKSHNLTLAYTWFVDDKIKSSNSGFSYSNRGKTVTIPKVSRYDGNKTVTCESTEKVKNGYTSYRSFPEVLSVHCKYFLQLTRILYFRNYLKSRKGIELSICLR